MAKVINITDKLSSDKPTIVIKDKEYPVNDGMNTVLKFEELVVTSSIDSMIVALELSLGEKAVEEIGAKKMSLANFKVLMTAILACMQGIEYEEADARFPKG